MAVVNKWSTCDLPSKPDADVFPTDSMYSFQAIRPATGTEIPQLNLPAGDYAVIRYVFIPFKGNETSADFSGIIFRSDSPNTTTWVLQPPSTEKIITSLPVNTVKRLPRKTLKAK